MSKKDKYLQIFNYLKEFSKIRSNPVRDIEASENQYPEKIWIADIPEHNLFDSALHQDFNKEGDYWIKVQKPKEPEKPQFPELPDRLKPWINVESLLDEENEPVLHDTIEADGKSFEISDFPEVQEAFEEYKNEKWIEDLSQYQEALEQYNERYKEFEKLNSIYKKFFKIYNKAQQFGEEYELIIGTGLLNFKEDQDTPKIFRHVLTQKVEAKFEYSNKESIIKVSPNVEADLQIETDFIDDLTEQFEPSNIINGEKSFESYIQENEVAHILPDEEIKDALQIFADRIREDGKFVPNVENKPDSIEETPSITYFPCLILRKRTAKSFTALYQKIIENIENEEENLDIPSIDEVIGDNGYTSNPFIEENENDPHPLVDNTIYFPKEYNNEQLEIVEKSRNSDKVLVQGPPGTGKSHTIANLISHLLANGNKVLVTAHTKRALEVLKEKLPDEIQNLAVNFLSGDSSSIQDLEKDVNAINEELSKANLSLYSEEVRRLKNETLKNIRESIAYKKNELVRIKEKETRSERINAYYEGTLMEIAEKLEKDAIKNEWYKDGFKDPNNQEILDQVEDYLEWQKEFQEYSNEDLFKDLPEKENLISIEDLSNYKEAANELSKYYMVKEEHYVFDAHDFNKLKELLNNLKSKAQQIDNIHLDFKEKFVTDYWNDDNQAWNEKISESEEILNRLESLNLKDLDRNVEVKYPEGISIKQLKNDAQTLLNYLNEGKSLTGIFFKFKKPILQNEIKEKLYFVEKVMVNGSPCDTIQEFQTIIQDLEIKQDLESLKSIWEISEPLKETFLSQYNYFKNLQDKVEDLINCIGKAFELINEIERNFEIDADTIDIDRIEDLLFETEYNHLRKITKYYKKLVENSRQHLFKDNIHSIAEKINQAYKQISTDQYQWLIEELERLTKLQNEFKRFKKLESYLEVYFPDLLDLIKGGSFNENNIPELKEAICFKHAQSEISKLLDEDYENNLANQLQDLEQKEKKTIEQLASKKAWLNVLEKLSENKELKQDLQAWVLAVKRIGKTGKGKKALKFRREAQKQMEKCKESVPCWIMPLYKVAETIQPEQEMYDYVIIDEASQLGPDAIFLMYISKNIIIVGDDKQTSPEYVGVTADTMKPHIQRHLRDIPRANFFGTEFSFFDHASIFCEDRTVLREHFRCMPEIIEFSNKNFYLPDGKGLYPLKQYSENRLSPIRTVFCKEGYIEGKYSHIINKPEAESIVETITELVQDETYKGKTFGIITLQGNQQSALIEDRLLKSIGEQEFHNRNIVCGNSASFQGDERDVIFLSLVTAHNHNRTALTKEEDKRRFNVAVSRAKEQIWLFHSIQKEDLSNTNDLRYKLLDHCLNVNDSVLDRAKSKLISIPSDKEKGNHPSPFDSWFEVEIYNEIVSRGYQVIPQYEVARGKYRIDLVVVLSNGTKIAVECDGDAFHGQEQFENDIMRQKDLERCGWQFFRIRGVEYYSNRAQSLEPLWELLNSNSKHTEDGTKEHFGEEQIEEENQKTESEDKSGENQTKKVIENTLQKNYKTPPKEKPRKSKALTSPNEGNLFGNEDDSQLAIDFQGNLKKTPAKPKSKIRSDVNLFDKQEFLVFTNHQNVYKLQNDGIKSKQEILNRLSFDQGERPIHFTGVNDYEGYLLTGFENGKIAKVPMESFKTKTNRKRLKNAFNPDSPLVFIKHIKEDTNLIAISSNEKVVLFNTQEIKAKSSKLSSGVQVMKLKPNTKLKHVKKIDEVKFQELEYYRKSIPATGNFLAKNDFYE